MPRIFSSPYKTVMVVNPAADGKTDPNIFSIHLVCALYALVERGYETFIFTALDDMEQVLLSHLAQIRIAYPDKCLATVQVEPRRNLYRNDCACNGFSSDFIHFVDDDPRGPRLTYEGLNNRMAKYLADNSAALLSLGNLSGRKEMQALKNAFPFEANYKEQYREELRLAPAAHKRLKVHIYEK